MGFELSGAARAVLASAALALSFAGGAAASTITGTPSDNPSFANWNCADCITPSTNALNFASNAPERPGQIAPYVIFDSAIPESVTLSFSNLASGLAFFEIRIDGVQTGTTAHPVVAGDTIHTGGVAVSSGTSNLLRTFAVNEYVEVRLALGAERDWDFDWTRFDAPVAPIPLPAAGWLLIGGLGALVAVRRRKPAA